MDGYIKTEPTIICVLSAEGGINNVQIAVVQE